MKGSETLELLLPDGTPERFSLYGTCCWWRQLRLDAPVIRGEAVHCCVIPPAKRRSESVPARTFITWSLVLATLSFMR